MMRYVFILFLVLACRDQKAKSLYSPSKSDYSSSVETTNPTKSDDAKGEGSKDDITDTPVTPPVQISGTFLRCMEMDSNVAIRIELGCRIENEAEVRISPASIAEESEFLLPELDESDVSVSLLLLSEDPNYEVTYVFEGSDFVKLRELVGAIRLQVNFLRLLTGEGNGYIVGEGASLLIEAPKPWWVREKTSDSNQDGLCQAGETCIFLGNGLVWLKDNGSIYGHAGGNSLCEDYADSYSDWRLPTENELLIAQAKRLSALGADTYLNLKSTRYWSSTDASSGGKLVIDLESGQSLARDQSDAFGVLCVRPQHSTDGVL